MPKSIAAAQHKLKYFLNSEKVNLTHREDELLFHLSETPNEVLDCSLILKKIWGDNDFFNARSMYVFITKLSKKLKKTKTLRL